MAVAQTTIIRVPSQDAQYSIPGDYTAAQIQTMYSTQIQGISSMTATSDEATGPNGVVRTITFSPRAGNKG